LSERTQRAHAKARREKGADSSVASRQTAPVGRQIWGRRLRFEKQKFYRKRHWHRFERRRCFQTPELNFASRKQKAGWTPSPDMVPNLQQQRFGLETTKQRFGTQ
jgi:hypothetical protein